jgi:hypothetical protein
MFGYAWMFWLLPFLFFLAFTRCRRHDGRAHAHYRSRPRREQDPDEQQESIDRLEQRLVDLEERLDFTERLLAQRNQEAPGPV